MSERCPHGRPGCNQCLRAVRSAAYTIDLLALGRRVAAAQDELLTTDSARAEARTRLVLTGRNS